MTKTVYWTADTNWMGDVEFGFDKKSSPEKRIEHLKDLMRNNREEILIVDMCGSGRGFPKEINHGLWELGVDRCSGTTVFSKYEELLKGFNGRKIETTNGSFELCIFSIPQKRTFVIMKKGQKPLVGKAVLEVLKESTPEEGLKEFCSQNGLHYPDVSGGGGGKVMSLTRYPDISAPVLQRRLNKFAPQLG